MSGDKFTRLEDEAEVASLAEKLLCSPLAVYALEELDVDGNELAEACFEFAEEFIAERDRRRAEIEAKRAEKDAVGS